MSMRRALQHPSAAGALCGVAIIALVTGACGSSGVASTDAGNVASASASPTVGTMPQCFPRCEGADLRNLDMRGLDLTRGDFTYAKLSASNLAGANLTEANLFRAQLLGTNLSQATLVKTRMEQVAASRVNFTNANMTDARLEMAWVYDSDLTGAIVTRLRKKDVKWNNTICPNGTVIATGC